MNPEILSQLKDVHLPKSPSWWPLASGYWLILFLIITCLIFTWFFYKKRKPVRLLKKQIGLELQKFEKEFVASGNTNALQSSLSQLLRRLLNKIDPSLEVNNISLVNLIPRLEKLWGAAQNRELIELLEQERYKKNTSLDGARLIALANKKFKQCKL